MPCTKLRNYVNGVYITYTFKSSHRHPLDAETTFFNTVARAY